MSASKDKERGTWKIYLRYVDWQGVKQIHTKRGFATKREALEYEREFLASKSRDLNMLFESFVEIYLSDLKPRIKYNTYLTKVHIIETKIIPYFAKKSIAEITAPDILQWQNELLKKSDGEGKSYSQTYLRTIQNQLNAILNHANKYYGLSSNPAHKTVHQKRGTEGMDDNGVLPAFQGIAMHDCWKSYWKYGVMHAVCCAHLLRELTGIEENDPNQKWATKFKELLLEMKKVKDKALLAGKSELSYYHLHRFDINYNEILQEAIDT